MGWLFNTVGELLKFIVGIIFAIIEPLFDCIGAIISFLIYNLISLLFQVFTTVAQTNILSEGQIGDIYQRTTIILTIVMTFYITFEFVKYVVQPDSMTDKEKGAGSVVTRIIVAIVLIAFVPRIFDIAYVLQNKIINNQVVPQIILGEKSENYQRLGSDFAADTLSLFLRVNEEDCAANSTNCAVAKRTVERQLQQIREKGEMLIIDPMIMLGITVESTDDGIKIFKSIEFDAFLAIVVGGFILYILVLYAIDLGKRYAQMIYLQIIAPIAIIGYISPKKDGIFQKWTKQCITTYIDVFIRLSIIYLILLIIGELNQEKDTLFNIGENVTFGVGLLSYIALVMGLLAFAQKAPKLLQDLFPSSGSASIGFGLGAKDRFEPTIKTGKAVWNAGANVAATGAALAGGFTAWKAAGSIAGMSKGARAWSAAKAAARGIKAGAGKKASPRKAQQAARASFEKDKDIVENEGTVLGHDFQGFKYQVAKEDKERQLKKLDDITKSKKTVDTAIGDIKVIKNIKSRKEEWDSKEFSDSSVKSKAVKDIEKATRVYAVSSQSDADRSVYEKAIATALSSVYDHGNNTTIRNLDATISVKQKQLEELNNVTGTLTVEQQQTINEEKIKITREIENAQTARTIEIERSNSERDLVYNDIISNIGKDQPALNILANEIKESASISMGQTYEGEITDEKTGAKYKGTKTVDKNLDIKEFAAEIGDVSDAAGNEANDIRKDPEYKKAKANASATSDKK